MAVKTTLEQLEEVQAAITELMSAEAYTADGVNVKRTNLAILEQREKMLLRRYRREQRNKGRLRLDMSQGV